MTHLANIGKSIGLFPPSKWLRADRDQIRIPECPPHNELQQSLSSDSRSHS